MVIPDTSSILAGPDADHLSGTHCTWPKIGPDPGSTEPVSWPISPLLTVYTITIEQGLCWPSDVNTKSLGEETLSYHNTFYHTSVSLEALVTGWVWNNKLTQYKIHQSNQKNLQVYIYMISAFSRLFVCYKCRPNIPDASLYPSDPKCKTRTKSDRSIWAPEPGSTFLPFHYIYWRHSGGM